jgi:ElaA protein
MMKWTTKTFEELSASELYDIIALRIEVFVVEQNCPYQDVDYKDQKSLHICAHDNDELVAYTRIPFPGVSYEEVAIGRVITKKSTRGTGLGHELIKESIKAINRQFGDVPIRLSAQTHLVGYYQRHHFQSTGKQYLEDGIPHTEMLLKPD